MDWTTPNMGPSSRPMPPEQTPVPPGGIIDGSTYGYLVIVFRVTTNPATALIALCVSILNIATFSKMNLNQGVNHALLILSVSDFCVSLLLVCVSCCYVLLWLDIQKVVGLYVLECMYFFLRFTTFPLYVSIMVTTVIAVVRSLSIALPFSFREVATIRRQFIAMGIGSAASLAIPSYMLVNFYSTFVGSSWSKKLKLMGQNCIAVVNCTMFDVSRYIFFLTCLFIIIVSMVFLIIALKKSSKFKALAAKATSENQAKMRQANKEAQVVKAVILVLAVFVAANVPLMVITIFRVLLTDTSSTGPYRYDIGLIDMLVGLGLNLNISLNTVIYFHYNSSFRAVLKSMLGQLSRSKATAKK
ncbi:hypothetical protein EGW08_007464 [Elysia chlorotica]|uniref:G-protein coupled receptors family 1 profile domain-containing protein n=1 Tax=Elysia chlorotica TaxID=188477 RepID=A0A3S1BC58_ELYCH|nr:hypothetical protein EGW08_007464 [Elysia chlorotica]